MTNSTSNYSDKTQWQASGQKSRHNIKNMNEEIEQTKKLIGLWGKIIGLFQSMLSKKKGISYLTIHHSASPATTTIEEINQWHKDRGFTLSKLGFCVGYHYLVFSDGDIIQTRLDNEIGYHTKNHNQGNLGICAVGNFEEYAPTPEQWRALTKLIDKKKAQYFIGNKEIFGHRDWSNTLCPGDNLYKKLKENYS